MYIHSPEDYPSFVGSFYALRKAGIISHFMLHVSKWKGHGLQVPYCKIDYFSSKWKHERVNGVHEVLFFFWLRSKTVETYNNPEVRDEPVQKRKCRFPEERMSPTMPYSFSQCFLYNRIQFELELCNCTIPTSPKECERTSTWSHATSLKMLKPQVFPFQMRNFIAIFKDSCA